MEKLKTLVTKASAIATLGAFAIGCGDSNPTGNTSYENQNNGNTKQANEGYIDNCFANHAASHRDQSVNYYASRFVPSIQEDFKKRGCAAISYVDGCPEGLRSIMKTAHTQCIHAAAYDIVQPGEHAQFGINFELNGMNQINFRKQVIVSPLSVEQKYVSEMQIQ